MSVEMESVFLRLLEVSAASAVVILAVVLLSSIINRSFTAKWKYWLWMVLAVRLLVPFNPSFEAAPAKVEVNIPYNPTITIPAPAARAVPAPPVQPTGPAVTIPVSQPVTSARIVDMVELLISVWLAGAAVFLLWQLVSYLRFRRQVERWGLPIEKDSVAAAVRQQVEAEFGIRGTIPALIYDQVSSPMMIGFFCPLLILPQEEYSAQSLSYILRHELTHYKRRDIWYKALMLLANAVHWFNPAVWLMAREASRDLEISCDAAVMKNAGMEERREYSEIILSCVHRELKMKTSLSTHFYGGKKALKERFANILSTKKRRRGLLAFAAVLLCGALAGGMVAFGIVNGSPPEYWARAALSELVTCTVENAEEFYAIAVPTPPTVEGPGITPAPEAIGEFFTRLWKDTMTEDCIQALISDGVFPRMADFVLERGREVRFVGWELRKRADGENLYDFTVQMAAIDEPPVAQAAGTIQMVKQEDGRWRASHITVAIEFIDRIPLEGWSYISSFSDPLSEESTLQIIRRDETAARLARAVSPLIATVQPPSFDSDHPLDADIAARIAFDNTPRLDFGGISFGPEGVVCENYPEHPIVKRLALLWEEGRVPCDVIYADDAAAALQRLFGITGWSHHTVDFYDYFPEEGVYITYGDLVRGINYPLVLSWEETRSGYSCEVVAVNARSNSIDGVEITEENIAELAQGAPHLLFTFDMSTGEPVVTGFAGGASTLSLQPGRIFPYLDPPQVGRNAVRTVKGTQAELDRWNTAIWDPAIVRLDFNNMHEVSMVLPVEQELEILTAMWNADVRLYEGNPDPSTGGGCSVIAYDGQENPLFEMAYVGDLFTVWFPGEEVSYYFDGEGTTLDNLLRSNYGVAAQPETAPLSVRLSQTNGGGVLMWEWETTDAAEMEQLVNLLSMEGLSRFGPDYSMWPDGGSPVEFQIDYGGTVVSGGCYPDAIGAYRYAWGWNWTIISSNGIFYAYPYEQCIGLMEFLESRGIYLGPWDDGGFQAADFNTAIVDIDGNSLGSYVEFTMLIPNSWTASGGSIYDEEGLLTAQVLPWIYDDADDNAFDRLAQRYPDADPLNVWFGQQEGMRYIQSATETDGPFVGAISNEIYYYLRRDNYLVGLKFYPKRDIGMGTQSEEFQSSIRIVPPVP